MWMFRASRGWLLSIHPWSGYIPWFRVIHEHLDLDLANLLARVPRKRLASRAGMHNIRISLNVHLGVSDRLQPSLWQFGHNRPGWGSVSARSLIIRLEGLYLEWNLIRHQVVSSVILHNVCAFPVERNCCLSICSAGWCRIAVTVDVDAWPLSFPGNLESVIDCSCCVGTWPFPLGYSLRHSQSI